MTVAERFDRTLINAISTAMLLGGIALIGWGILLFAGQCLGWLRFGAWQPVPLFTLWLSPGEQFNQLVPMDLWEANWSPLSLAPSLAEGASLAQVSQALGGKLAGLVKNFGWLLSCPLSISLALTGAGSLFGGAVMADSHLPQGRAEEVKA